MVISRYPKVKGYISILEYSEKKISFEWREEAACRHSDMSLFFPDKITRENISLVKKAFSLCEQCPVISHCMKEALEFDYDGIWARSTKKQRSSYIRHVRGNNIQNITIEECIELTDDICQKNITPVAVYKKGKREDALKNYNKGV